MLNDLNELLRFESVKGEKTKDAPFGVALKDSLDWFLNKAKSYGMKTENLDGYCGYAEIGEGKKMLGILCHLDVVPAGNGWNCKPYNLTIDDKVLYGRGVVDNKGPLVVALHVLKKLQEKNEKTPCRIRLIVGCDEESGSKCMAHYAKKAEIPSFSIVPDADFPIVSSEKGILHLEINIPNNNIIKSLQFGDRANVIPSKATAIIKGKQFLNKSLEEFLFGEGIEKDTVTLTDLGDGTTKIETKGIAGHAMNPEKADSAAAKLFAVLKWLNSQTGAFDGLETLYDRFFSPLSNERLGIDYKDSKSGALTMAVTKGKFEKNNLCFTADLRLPLCAKKNEVIIKIKKALPEKTVIKTLYWSPNLYHNVSDKRIQTLLDIYAKHTDESPAPVKTGGGTYAKALPNAIAFGPSFTNTQTNIHNIDECISLAHFEKWFEIYYDAIRELAKIL